MSDSGRSEVEGLADRLPKKQRRGASMGRTPKTAARTLSHGAGWTSICYKVEEMQLPFALTPFGMASDDTSAESARVNFVSDKEPWAKCDRHMRHIAGMASNARFPHKYAKPC